MYLVPGNHDVGEAPTSDSLSLYRYRFGPDNYSFDHGDCHFVVINSSVAFDPVNVPGEWDNIVQFMSDDLSAAKSRGAQHLVLFTHHPLFQEHVGEEDSMWTVPTERRDVIVSILRDYDAAAVFAGHLHKNVYADDAGLMMVTTGAVGYPLGLTPQASGSYTCRKRRFGTGTTAWTRCRTHPAQPERPEVGPVAQLWSWPVVTGSRSRPSTTVIVSRSPSG